MVEVGPRRKLFKEITVWKEGREIKKAEAIRAQMDVHIDDSPAGAAGSTASVIDRLKHSLSMSLGAK